MSTYVFSDVHGHAATLRRVLDRIAPSEQDRFFCLGDMIDRGPEPIEVLRIVRDLPNACVLMGNHEDLMLACLENLDDQINAYNWAMNGGQVTSEALAALDDDVADELVSWVASLPRWAVTQVEGQLYVLTHAGILSSAVPARESWDERALRDLLAEQAPDDLLWIREEFWGAPTGLVNEKGEGPIVIAGHTPTPYLDRMADVVDRPSRDENGLAQMVRVGACESTGGVADRWDIDCGAAGGAGFGQVMVLRLDDQQEFCEPILEGE